MRSIIVGISLLLLFCNYSFAQGSDSLVYESKLLIAAEDMPVSNGQLIVLPQKGLFIADGNTFYSLDTEECPHVEKFRILEDIPFDQVIVNDNEFIVKSQQFMLILGGEKTEILAEFDTEDYSLFSGVDSVINVVVREEGNFCTLYKYDRRTGDLDNIMRLPENIKKIVAGNKMDFYLLEKGIYYLYDTESGELATSEQPILDMILLPDGLMFCTETMLYLINDDGVVPLMEGSFHGLQNDGHVIYITLQNGNIWKMKGN